MRTETPLASYRNALGEDVVQKMCGCYIINGRPYIQCQAHKFERKRKSNGQIRF